MATRAGALDEAVIDDGGLAVDVDAVAVAVIDAVGRRAQRAVDVGARAVAEVAGDGAEIGDRGGAVEPTPEPLRPVIVPPALFMTLMTEPIPALMPCRSPEIVPPLLLVTVPDELSSNWMPSALPV